MPLRSSYRMGPGLRCRARVRTARRATRQGTRQGVPGPNPPLGAPRVRRPRSAAYAEALWPGPQTARPPHGRRGALGRAGRPGRGTMVPHAARARARWSASQHPAVPPEPEDDLTAVATSTAPKAGSTDPSVIRNFCIIAHIDHGKSTLADRMLQITGVVDGRAMRAQYLDRMDIERERGITIKSQAVRLPYTARDGVQYVLNLIDTPGHVDFTYEVSRSLAACEGAILLVDAAQGIEAQTLANLYLALENDLHIIPVLNKIDLPAAQPEKYAAELAKIIGCDPADVLRVSAKTGLGVDDLLDEVVRTVPAPIGDPKAPARAIIFDSVYDSYRGVVTYVRVIDGHLSPRERIQMMSTGVVHEMLEVGVISPDPTPSDGHRRRRGRLPHHRGEGRPPVARRRHGHLAAQRRHRAARRLPRPQADGLLRPLSARRLGLPRAARRPRQAAAQRRGARLRARDLGRARLRLPLRLPRPAAPRDRARAARARVQPRPHLHRAHRGLPGGHGRRLRGRR